MIRILKPSTKPAESPKPPYRNCKVCKARFQKRSMGHVACSPACAQILAERAREKKAKADYQARKQAIKTRSDYLKEAQIAFNSYIRERDKNRPCICCGEHLSAAQVGGAFDAGHYRSVGSAPHLRFDPNNCHAQRKRCNRYGAGRAVDYRIGLIARIGIEAVEALEADQTPRKWTIDELKAKKAEYRAKRKALAVDKGVA